MSAFDILLVSFAALPGVYGVVSLLRRIANATRAARWVKTHHREAWDELHWLARHNAWAGVEVLISKGLISGPEVDAFRRRDEKLEKATWLGLLVSVALLVLFGLLHLLYYILA